MSTMEREPRIPMTPEEREDAFAEIEAIHRIFREDQLKETPIWETTAITIGYIIAVAMMLLVMRRLFSVLEIATQSGWLEFAVTIALMGLSVASGYLIGKARAIRRYRDALRSGR